MAKKITTAVKKFMCPVCDVTPILKKVGKRVVVTEHYSEGYMGLNNGSILKFGICSACLNALTDKQARYALERFKQTWHNDLVGKGTKKQFDKIKKLKMKCKDFDKKKCLKKMKKVEKEEHEKKLKPKDK